jgi:hypothetical protein
MSKVTPKQKAKAEQFIKDNIGPKSYKSNAYGELQMLYDFVNDNDLSKMNDEERSDFFIEISDLKNRLIDWVKDTPQKQYQFVNIIFRIKSLYAAFYNIEVFTDIEKNRIELNDAFDFELEPKELKNNLLIENAESRILKAINEVESKAEKTSTINSSQTEDFNNDYLEYKKLFEKDIPNAAFKELEGCLIVQRIAFLYITGDLERFYEDDFDKNPANVFDKIRVFTGGVSSYSNLISGTFRDYGIKNLDHEKNLKHIQAAVRIAKKYKVEIHSKYNEY